MKSYPRSYLYDSRIKIIPKSIRHSLHGQSYNVLVVAASSLESESNCISFHYGDHKNSLSVTRKKVIHLALLAQLVFFFQFDFDMKLKNQRFYNLIY
jgi:hypothetical protein